jgi:hypothetical protein
MRGWKIFFAAAALFNLCIGLAVMLMPQASAPAPLDGAALLPIRVVGWFVFVFGIGYAIVATEPLRHAGIVRIGVIGKLGMFVITLLAWNAGLTQASQAIPALFDLPWAVAFLVFLSRTAKRS